MRPCQFYRLKFSLLIAIQLGLIGTLCGQVMPAYYGVYSRVNTSVGGTTIPNIVSDNLAVHYDAANNNSYPRTGTTWKDLKANADATLTNGPVFSSSYGGMMTFDGVNDRAVSTSTTLSYSTGFTVEIVVKFNSISGNQGLVSFNNEGNSKYINLWKANGAGLRWEINAAQSITGTNNLSAGVWYHFTGVFDGTNAKLYRNGVLETSATFSSSNTSTTASYIMGDFNAIGSYPLNGNIAISRFYTKALTATEVLQNYNATRLRFAEIVSSGLMMNLALAPPTSSGTAWTDMSGNGNHGTVTGTTSYVSTSGGGITTNTSSYIKTSYNLGTNFTLSMACSLNPSSYWATVWGNENWFASKGYLAYLFSSTNLAVGSPTYVDAFYSISGIGSINIWDYVVSGTSLTIYKNGTSVYSGTFSAPSGGISTTGLYFGARHMNDGNSFSDACPGTYYSMRVYNRSLSSAEITTNFGALRNTYGL